MVYIIYANIWGILMVNVTIYIAYMDPLQAVCVRESPSESPLDLPMPLRFTGQTWLAEKSSFFRRLIFVA